MGTISCICKWCEQPFQARTADRRRGWAKCCSKACAASYREFGHSKAFYEARNPRTPNIVRYAQRQGVTPKPPKWIRGVLAGAMFQPNNRDQYEDEEWGHPHASGYEGHGQS